MAILLIAILRFIAIILILAIILAGIGGVGVSIFNSWDGMTWVEVPLLDRLGFILLSIGVSSVAFFIVWLFTEALESAEKTILGIGK